ncbi:unnamed protein product [Prorocentrum cordatum]|uniref:Uncharacterized protein n=1 Tax=Prorocentrum cordatum TaxID=2364126 RepID=A0ABN9UCS1_9DINO|nr:unnamed protein product [Polarella glacialis]
MINHQKRQPPTSSCPKPVTGRDLSEGAEKQRKAEREGSGEGQTREAPEETKSEPRAKAAQQRPPRRRATLACRRRWSARSAAQRRAPRARGRPSRAHARDAPPAGSTRRPERTLGGREGRGSALPNLP